MQLVGPVPVKASGPDTLQILPSPRPIRVQNFYLENGANLPDQSRVPKSADSLSSGSDVIASSSAVLKYEKGPSLHFVDEEGKKSDNSITVKEVRIILQVSKK